MSRGSGLLKNAALILATSIICALVMRAQDPAPVLNGITVTLTVTHGKDGTISVVGQDGRGLLFYRGAEEIQEYLNQPEPAEDWEILLKTAVREKFKADPDMSDVKSERYVYRQATVAKKL